MNLTTLVENLKSFELRNSPSGEDDEVLGKAHYNQDRDEHLINSDHSSRDDISKEKTADVESVEYSQFSEDDVNAILPSVEDDEDMPASTFRMWILCLVFGAVVGGTDSFFALRFPSVKISVVVVLMVTWPVGVVMHKILPAWDVPLPWGMGFSLNPGPFNYKEHACIYIFTNLVTSAGLVNHLVAEDIKFFKVNTGIGRQILFNLSIYVFSFGLIGLARDVIVTPEDRVWPGVLSSIALFKAIYAKGNPVANGWKMSRWIFLVIVFFCSFIWYWFPDFIMPFLSTIGAWISWIKPDSAALSQVFGVKTGLGLFPLTFDWTQITSINNPLTTPFSAVASMFGSFVFWIWIVLPGLYYTNHWNTAHFPIMTNKVYTVDMKKYDFLKVVNSNWRLDKEKYTNYSPPMLPIAFLINLAMGFGVFASLIVTFILEFPNEIARPWCKRADRIDKFNLVAQKFKSFPIWIYPLFCAIGLGLGFAFCQGWESAPIDAGGYAAAVGIGSVLFIPLSLVEARANAILHLSTFLYIVSANWYKGQPLKLLYFYTIGQSIIQHGVHCAQGAKVGHYLRIKPRIYMTLLLAAGIWSSLVSPAVTGYLLYHFEDICTLHAKNNMTCRKQRTSFNKQGIWGLFGSEIFAPGGRYSWVLWFFLVGAAVSIVHFVLLKWRGRNSFISKFDPVLFFGGAEEIPSVTGYNYSTWFFTAFVFNYLIHRRFTAWWRKYNLVASVGMDCGVAITLILVYFALNYTGVSTRYKWWGTEVSSKGCDHKGCPYLNEPVPKPTSFY